MEEIWRPVKGHDKYEVSNYGRVRKNTKKNGTHLCAMREIQRGYTVSLDSKEYQVGRIVAEAFIPNPYNCEIVEHKDGDASNNHITNLQWTTRAERFAKTGCKSFKHKGHIAWYDEHGELKDIFRKITDAAKATGKSNASVNSIILGKTKQTIEGWTFKRIKE